MATKSHLTHAVQVFYGAVKYHRFWNIWKHFGVKITPELFWHNFGAPITADPNGVIETQDLTALGVFSGAGIAGALAAAGVATFDVPRAVVAAWTGAAVLTVTGTDEYGSIITESSASGTSLTGTKAFKTVTAVSTSADITGLTVGHGDVLGLPYRVDANGLVAARAANAIDAGVFVPAVTTDPATATTGDVRGTFNPAVALNGANTVAVLIKIADPSTKVGAFGIKQFGSTDSA